MEEVDLVSRRTAANGGNRVEGKPQKDITSAIFALQNGLKLDELAPAVDWLMQRVYGNDPSLATAPS